jgi:ankyrin repeat protein
LFETYSIDPAALNNAGETALMVAAREGKFEVCKFFVEKFGPGSEYF